MANEATYFGWFESKGVQLSFVKECFDFKQEILKYWKKNGVPHTKAMHNWKTEFILKQIRDNDISTVLETGTCMGVTIMVIAHAIELAGRKPRCWSLDIRNRGQSKVFNAFPDFRGKVEMHVYKPGQTAKFLEEHDIPELDFLSLDGDHTREGVKYDYETFEPRTRKGGLIVFDDVSIYGKFKGNENPNAYVRSLGDVHFIPNYPAAGEIGQSGPDFFAYMYKDGREHVERSARTIM